MIKLHCSIFRMISFQDVKFLGVLQYFYFSTEPTVIAKSSLGIDVKPWDDETDMKKLEECVRSIAMDGLLWGQCKYKKI